MGNNVINLKMEDICRAAMALEGLEWEDLREYEIDAGLGNGGLGRLAACSWIRLPPWIFPRSAMACDMISGFSNRTSKTATRSSSPRNGLNSAMPGRSLTRSFRSKSTSKATWRPGPAREVWSGIGSTPKPVIGIPYDLPVVGYGRKTVITLRLWSAKSAEEFHLDDFNRGEYVEAVVNKVLAENLTKVLYPEDAFSAGKELRLKQEYFFVSCTIQDILRRFKSRRQRMGNVPGQGLRAAQRYPPCACDPGTDAPSHGFGRVWSGIRPGISPPPRPAIRTTRSCPKRWRNGLERLLPRHLQIMYQINARFLREVACRHPYNVDRLRRMIASSRRASRSRCAWLTWRLSVPPRSTVSQSCTPISCGRKSCTILLNIGRRNSITRRTGSRPGAGC